MISPKTCEDPAQQAVGGLRGREKELLTRQTSGSVTRATFEEVTNRLVKTYNPLKIYLFGSYAWGHPDEDSDVDLLIVVEKSDEKSYKRAIAGFDALFGLGISKDLLVLTNDEFEQRAHQKSTLMYKIKEEGKLLYSLK